MNNCLACLRYGDEFYFPFQALLVWIKIQERDFDTSSNIFIVLAELRLFIGLNHVLALIPIKLISLLYLAQPSTNI